ncbi:MAG: hypothetical protein LIP08_07680 [Bacteroides sp.]|nr:hypothetical protein [Bacteroides sp.]
MPEKATFPLYKASELLLKIRNQLYKNFGQFTQDYVTDAIMLGRTRLSDIETDKHLCWKNLHYIFAYYTVYLQDAPELIEAFHILADTQCITPKKWEELRNKKEADTPYEQMLLEKIRKAEQLDISALMRKYMP